VVEGEVRDIAIESTRTSRDTVVEKRARPKLRKFNANARARSDLYIQVAYVEMFELQESTSESNQKGIVGTRKSTSEVWFYYFRARQGSKAAAILHYTANDMI
jgi:hypothetical protein